jgi:tryptophan synthase alpha chain
VLFDQLKDIRKSVSIPLIMGYFNPMLQYGVENFCKNVLIGIDGLIIPDLPVDVYADEYKEILKNTD